jgi:DNA-binding XRE family transcriptional regulator
MLRHFRVAWRHGTMRYVPGETEPADLDVPFEELSVPQRVRRVRRYGPNGRLSHERLGQLLGTSRQTVIAWEGGRGISEEYREKLAEYSGHEPSAFFVENHSPITLADLSAKVDALDQRLDKLATLAGQILQLNQRAFHALGVVLEDKPQPTTQAAPPPEQTRPPEPRARRARRTTT